MKNQKCDKESTQMFRRTQKRNQNLIARRGNSDVHSTGRQEKPLPKTFDQFIAPTLLKYINGRWNFHQQRKFGISVSGSIWNQVLSKRALPVQNNWGSPQNVVALTLKLVFSQKLAVKIKDTQSRRLKEEALIPHKMPDPLKVPQNLWTAMSQCRYIFLAYAAVKITQFCQSVSGASHGKQHLLISLVVPLHFKSTFWALSSSKLACVCVLPTGVSRVNNGKTWCRCALVYFVKHLIKLWQHKIYDEPKNYSVIRNSSGDTNWSLVDPWVDFSPLPPQNGKEKPADVLWPELQQTKDPRSTDVKQENLIPHYGVNEE